MQPIQPRCLWRRQKLNMVRGILAGRERGLRKSPSSVGDRRVVVSSIRCNKLLFSAISRRMLSTLGAGYEYLGVAPLPHHHHHHYHHEASGDPS